MTAKIAGEATLCQAITKARPRRLALEALTPAQRAVLLLREVRDYSTAETAEAVEMKESNVKVTLHRARRIMEAYNKNRVASLSKHAPELRGTLQSFLSRLSEGDVEGLRRADF